MEELKMCSVSDKYIDYLRHTFPNVYSNKIDTRIHTRKYIGIVLKIDDIYYYIPMSSPKDTDYQIAGDKKVIKKSIVPIIRITAKNSKGEKELKGTLRISHMIPVPQSEITLYDVDNEIDLEYKDLVKDQSIFIHDNSVRIRNNAELLYKQKKENDLSAGYVKTALDYMELEKKYQEFLQLTNVKSYV